MRPFPLYRKKKSLAVASSVGPLKHSCISRYFPILTAYISQTVLRVRGEYFSTEAVICIRVLIIN